MEAFVREDWRLTVREIGEMIPDVSKTTVGNISIGNLGYHKVCARWVPRMLNDEHKQKRVDSSREFLHRYEDEGEEFPLLLETIIFSPVLKKHCGGIHCVSNEKVTVAANKFLRVVAGEWYDWG